MAIGRPHLSSIPVVTTICLRCLFIWLLYDGSVRSFLAGLVLASLTMYPLLGQIQKALFGVPWRDFLGAQLQSLFVTACTGAVAGLSFLAPADTPSGVLILCGAIFVPLVWLHAICWSAHPLWPEVLVISANKPSLSWALRAIGLRLCDSPRLS